MRNKRGNLLERIDYWTPMINVCIRCLPVLFLYFYYLLSTDFQNFDIPKELFADISLLIGIFLFLMLFNFCKMYLARRLIVRRHFFYSVVLISCLFMAICIWSYININSFYWIEEKKELEPDFVKILFFLYLGGIFAVLLLFLIGVFSRTSIIETKKEVKDLKNLDLKLRDYMKIRF